MAQGDVVDFLLDLDMEEFSSKIASAVDYVKNLQSELAKVATVAGVVGAAYLALKTSLSLAFEAEELKSLQVQFDALSKQAGVSGDAILEGMNKASDGLIDASDQMRLANKALVQLGGSASKIPEIMEIARKASIIFGTSTEEAFGRITQAISTGQARQLRQLGVVVDTEAAYKKYAASIGVATAALTEQDKVTAFQNAVLPQLQSKLANVDTTVKSTTDSWTRFGNSIKEVGEAIAKTSVVDKFRAAWTQLLTTLTERFNAFGASINATFGTGKVQAEGLQQRIVEISKTLEDAKNKPKEIFSQAEVDALTAKVKSLKEELQSLNKGGVGEKFGPPEPTKTDTAQNLENEKARREKIKQLNIAFYAELNKLSEESLNAKIQNEKTFGDVEKDTAAQKVLLEKETQEKLLEIRNDPKYNKEQKDQLEAIAEQSKSDRLVAINEKAQERISKALENNAKTSKSIFQKIGDDWTASTTKGADGTIHAVGGVAVAMTSLKGSFSNTFIAMGKGAKIGTDVIAKAFFGMIGDVAIHYGELALATSIWPPNPLGLAAAAGLFILGGTMKALAGDGGDSGAGAGTATASAAQQNSSFGETGSGPMVAEARERKSVNIVVQGHLFDTPQTGVRIAEILRDVTGATDVRIT